MSKIANDINVIEFQCFIYKFILKPANTKSLLLTKVKKTDDAHHLLFYVLTKFAKIIRPAEVCNTLSTSTVTVLSINFAVSSITIIVPSGK